MPATIPTQEDLDKLKLAFDDHLKEVDAKLLEYHDRVSVLEAKFTMPVQEPPYPEDPDNPVNPNGNPPLDPPPSPKAHKKHK